MKIGIGVTTCNRPVLKSYWEYIARELTRIGICFYINDDSTERKGIAHSKNKCLRNLNDCDYIFLFDDDCFPLKSGWIKLFTDTHQLTGQHHFSYMREVDIVKKVNEFDGIEVFNNCKGCFMFFTKECIEKVGLFNEEYGQYGFEHAEYSLRVHKAGLTKYPYMSVKGSSEYIYSLDFDFKSSLTDTEKNNCVKENLPKFQKYLKEN